ncbi:MAG: hypothetical protein GY749_22880 [Desulfobacteraceae bacterium]|nr:hypothetical protein [Desulfobacteraceae bacterium]
MGPAYIRGRYLTGPYAALRRVLYSFNGRTKLDTLSLLLTAVRFFSLDRTAFFQNFQRYITSVSKILFVNPLGLFHSICSFVLHRCNKHTTGAIEKCAKSLCVVIKK